MNKKLLAQLSLIFGIVTVVSLFAVITIAHLKTAAAAPNPKLLFGLGTEAVDAVDSPLVKEAPIKMLSSWFNSTADLEWMADSWHTAIIKDLYAKGYSHHLIVYTNDSERSFDSINGPACGRPYAASDQFVQDMEKLAEVFKGDGTLYVTLLTEFQDYACENNQWQGNENYFNALKSKYLLAMQKMRAVNPNAKVSLGWGGWQARFDDPATGAGRSLFAHFDDVMKQSQFQSFQSMQSDSNTKDIRDMTKVLGAYGPVMLAHYKPDNSSQATFDADVRAILTDAYLEEVTANGLFALSFMDDKNISGDTLNFLKGAVAKYSGVSVPVIATTTPAATIVSTPEATPVVTASATPSPSEAPLASESVEPSVMPTATATPIPTPEVTPSNSPQPSPTLDISVATAVSTFVPTTTPAPTIVVTPSPTATTAPTVVPTAVLTSPAVAVPIREEVLGTIAPSTTPVIAVPTSRPARVIPTRKSRIKIFAEGTSALKVFPSMQLMINNTIVKTFKKVGKYTEYQYSYPGVVLPSQIKIAFINDLYLPLVPQDRNLRIDKIMINDTTYETEAPNVSSLGSWTSETGCAAGHKDSEWLHCNGYVQY